MKMYLNELIVCLLFVCVALTTSVAQPSSSTHSTSSGNFKEKGILRDREASNVARGQSTLSKQTDVNRSRKLDSSISDKIDVDDENENDAYELIDSSFEDGDEPSIEADVNESTSKDQIRMLTKELNALKKKQQNDYENLELHVRKSVRKAAKQFTEEQNLRTELEQLR